MRDLVENFLEFHNIKIPVIGAMDEIGKVHFHKGCYNMHNPNDPFHSDSAYLLFLEMAGQGCISGNIIEWPQLKPACKWAAEEIIRLRNENIKLKSVQ